MSHAEHIPLENEPNLGSLYAIEGENLNPEIMDEVDRKELTDDILQQLQKPASFDLYIGLVSGIAIRTKTIEEANLENLILATRKVQRETLDNDLSRSVSSDVMERVSDTQDYLLNEGNVAAEILLDVVQHERYTPRSRQATYLNRFFLLSFDELSRQ